MVHITVLTMGTITLEMLARRAITFLATVILVNVRFLPGIEKLEIIPELVSSSVSPTVTPLDMGRLAAL